MADPLDDFFASTPREPRGLSGRSGSYGDVDAALNELRLPAELDEDGDWTLQTDVGQLALLVDDISGDFVVIQSLQSLEVEESTDFMHALLRLNFEAPGAARFGAITQGSTDISVISARVTGSEISTATVERLLADVLSLSRRLDELLGREPAGGAAEPGAAAEPAGAEPAGAEPAGAEPEPAGEIAGSGDVTAFAPVPTATTPGAAEPGAADAGGPAEPGAEPAGATEPATAASGDTAAGGPADPPPPDQQPVAAPAAETVFAQPVPEGPPPAAAPDAPAEPEPAPAEPAYPPPSVEPAPAEPAYPPPSVEPAQPAAQDPPPEYPPPPSMPEYPPPAYEPPQPELPPANWYPDPYYQARLRYWDGQQWTEHVAQ